MNPSNLELFGGCVSLHLVDRRVRNSLLDAPQGRLYAIRNARRQDVGPLSDGLVRHTDGIGGGGDVPAKKSDRFGLVHGILNHRKGPDAIGKCGSPPTVTTMVDYRDRFALAMELAGKDIHATAAALSVSYNAVKKVLTGGTNSLTAANNSIAAEFFRVDPDWLARGVGEPHSRRVWPFRELSPEQWHKLPAVLRQAAEKMLLGHDAG